MLFKCKVCGGDLDIQANASVGTCQYCGTKQTLPRLADDKRANLYERANHFRRQNDFDKASALYESILNEDGSDAEAYWSLVLCKYGVEYVEDPTSRQRIPTCNRTQYASVLADEDYKQALAHADEYQRSLYESEAKAIDDIQKGILEISSKEEPFDVFICYKESDDNGRRTPDSVLAQDMYHQLTDEGFKVFFSRITLEDKIGRAYEPYIFAALQSSKIMVALGTKPEYFNAVWVKNEWSRYLGLIKGGAKKTLIPAYRDMDPYALPEEFSNLQAQDMGKLGFMQDLVRGIKKILAPAQSQPAAATAAPSAAVASTNSLMQRAFIELEDGNWKKADSLLEKVLNVEPQNAKAYVGKLMAEQGIGREENLATCRTRLTDNGNFQKAFRFADDAYKSVLEGYSQAVEERLEVLRKQGVYDQAVKNAEKLEKARNDSESLAAVAEACRRVADVFRTIPGFSNADELAQELDERADTADQMAADRLKRERRAKLAKRLVKIGIVAVIALGIATYTAIIPAFKHLAAERAIRAEAAQQAANDREEAAKLAAAKKELAAKRTAADKAWADKASAAAALLSSGKYAEAMSAFKAIGGYRFGGYNWRILDIQGGKALLITENIVEDKPFNDKDANVSWETCSLRKYLNGDFYNRFSAKERSRIAASTISNPKYGAYGGKATTDNIFLLSVDEARNYFKDFPKDKVRGFPTMGEADKYYKANGDRVAIEDNGERLSWWLRSPGGTISGVKVDHDFAATVDGARGDIEARGTFVNISQGVRPALWLNLQP